MMKISLYDMPYEVMLIIEHHSNVWYKNQVGGQLCWQAELEGVLAPVDLAAENVEHIRRLAYPGAPGITSEIAEAIDAILATDPGTRYISVDRDCLETSMEAWIFVRLETPTTADDDPYSSYFGSPSGFGLARGILTWPNSD